LPHKMCSSHSCFVESSPQRLIKATYPPRPQGTKALGKGDLACAAVSTSCLVLSSCIMQPAMKAQEQEQPQLAAGTGRGTARWRRCSMQRCASCGWWHSPLEPQKERRAPGLLSVRD
jgi:hypothetical protein